MKVCVFFEKVVETTGSADLHSSASDVKALFEQTADLIRARMAFMTERRQFMCPKTWLDSL
jgi:hypothetical protein